MPDNQAVVIAETEQNENGNNNSILSLINSVFNDAEHQNEISVLPLMCGSGKSTAISQKMREVIEANDGNGLLIVTDKIDRMEEYCHPHDEELRAFMSQNEDKFTIMKSETVDEAARVQRSRPILLMSTQRFVRLTHEDIDGYLNWDGGRRPLILIDEQPYLLEQIPITIEDLNRVKSAIDQGIPQYGDTAADHDRLADYWIRISDVYIQRAVRTFDSSYYGQKNYYFFWKPNWNDEDTFNDFLNLATKYKNELNHFRPNEYVNVYTIIRAVHQLLCDGAVLSHVRTPTAAYANTFFVVLDNSELFRNYDGVKTIILDGTADISPVYSRGRFHFVNAGAYARSLDRLHIDLVNITCGKTQLQSDRAYRNIVFEGVQQYLRTNIPENEPYAVFTYQWFEKEAAEKLPGHPVEHFGNIRGRNTFRDKNTIIQIGLNHFPAPAYFIYEYLNDPVLREKLDRASYDDHTDIIQDRVHSANSITAQTETLFLLMDIEQNLFRGSIRSSDAADPFRYVLFFSHRYYHNLIVGLEKRFSPLHAHITIHETPDSVTQFQRERTNAGHNNRVARRYERNTRAAQIIRWHNSLPIGQEYTSREIRAAIIDNATSEAISPSQMEKLLERYPAIKAELSKERVSKGRYRMNGIWNIEP